MFALLPMTSLECFQNKILLLTFLGNVTATEELLKDYSGDLNNLTNIYPIHDAITEGDSPNKLRRSRKQRNIRT